MSVSVRRVLLASDPRLIGTSQDGANHQYDLTDFWTALGEDKLPSVTYLKAGAYQDAHPGYSDPAGTTTCWDLS
jgi:phospholipase C